MNSPQATERPASQSFRCPVQSDQSQAVIRVGRRRARATLQETSIDGFTVLVAPRDAWKLKVGRPWVLEYEGARIEIHPQWFFNAPDGHVQMGMRRLRDLTRPERIHRSWLTRFGGRRYESPSYSAAAYGGFVLVLFMLLALPGLGDHLGTSDRIQGAFRWFVQECDQAFSKYL